MKQYRMPSPYLGLRSGCQGHEGRCRCFEPWATVLTGTQQMNRQMWAEPGATGGITPQMRSAQSCFLDFIDLLVLLSPSAAANTELSKSTVTLRVGSGGGGDTGRSTEHKHRHTHTCCLLWLARLWLMYNMVLWLFGANTTLVKHLKIAMQTCKARLWALCFQ